MMITTRQPANGARLLLGYFLNEESERPYMERINGYRGQYHCRESKCVRGRFSGEWLGMADAVGNGEGPGCGRC